MWFHQSLKWFLSYHDWSTEVRNMHFHWSQEGACAGNVRKVLGTLYHELRYWAEGRMRCDAAALLGRHTSPIMASSSTYNTLQFPAPCSCGSGNHTMRHIIAVPQQHSVQLTMIYGDCVNKQPFITDNVLKQCFTEMSWKWCSREDHCAITLNLIFIEATGSLSF